jgi:glycosyltransferase involved in cell wall biosynthesis
MPQEPFISVVIPTRNRAHLLRHAIQSVLRQDFDDYELIVSDNCSDDGTAEVIREVGGDRVRYVRPDSSLSMPDHWEFALDQARGRYVAYLCDDDAWAPSALSRVASLLSTSDSQLVVLYSGVYYAPNWLDPKLQNVATFAPFTSEVREHRSADTIRRLFGSCRVVYEAPRMLNSFCHRETMLRVRRAAGKIFQRLCPDYSFAVTALTAIPSWLYLDEPLHLQGVFPEGIGSAAIFNRGEPERAFAREFKEDELMQRVPLKNSLVSNYITETYLRCQESLPELARYSVDWIQYFLSCWNDILVFERNGVDVSADKEQFFRVLAAQPAGVRERVEVIVGCAEGEDPFEAWALRHPMRASVRKVIARSALLTNLESVVRQRKGNGSHPPEVSTLAAVSGSDVGFTNILECALRLPGLARKETVVAAPADTEAMMAGGTK